MKMMVRRIIGNGHETDQGATFEIYPDELLEEIIPPMKIRRDAAWQNTKETDTPEFSV
ncbi:MAG: hypothetical protein M1378_07960 [Bacteroidetes bacterium]|nr:hypothetical protein [Bacteroidota bacterium]